MASVAEKEASVSKKIVDADVIDTKKKRDSAQMMGLGAARITEWAEERVERKRKKKGLTAVQPRKKGVFTQLYVHGASMTAASLAIAPLERARIIHQTQHLNAAKIEFPATSAQLFPMIVQQQGVAALWRGVMPLVYKQWLSMGVKILFYDKIKHTVMPYDIKKYSGLDYFIRAASASLLSMTAMTLFTYPFDLFHTRTAVDMTTKGNTRLYKTTFEVFNRTNMDEGRLGLYKGVEYAVASSVLRAMLTLPAYDLVKSMDLGANNTSVGAFQQRIGTAMCSGLLISLLLYPLDTLKRSAQLEGGLGFKKLYSSQFEMAKTLPGELGVRGLYRGVPVFMLSQVFFAFAQFTVYDMILETKISRGRLE